LGGLVAGGLQGRRVGRSVGRKKLSHSINLELRATYEPVGSRIRRGNPSTN